MPAIFELYRNNMLPDKFAILGTASSEFSDEEFRANMHSAIKTSLFDPDNKQIENFLKMLYYIPLDFNDKQGYNKLAESLKNIDIACGRNCNFIFYLATIPGLFEIIAENLADIGLNAETEGFRRIIIEKPFGNDLDSSKKLNDSLHINFNENQIYRIDHYLGKETVQNVLVTRFANGIFEPIWNRNYIHHVEITSSESIGIESRGKYYEQAGALRDMLQSHLLRLVALVAMEPPSSFEAEAVRNEQIKVLQSLRPLSEKDIEKNVIRGQYVKSTIKGKKIKGYRDEENVKEKSRTETYTAIKFYIDNWRWGGVPFYIRTGKRLPIRVTEAVIHFKKTPHYLFSKETEKHSENQLILRIQPDEGIVLKFAMKEPGSGYHIHNVNMDFHYKDLAETRIPEAYERLLYDCMIGDSTLFLRADAVEAAWKFVEPIQKAWADDSTKIYGYPAGTWGPEVADDLIEGKKHTWRYPCKNLADDGIYCKL